jgi:acetyltransferase-like isoleucine patch superfamily enzyme
VAPVHVGAGAVIGPHAALGPGVEVAPGAEVAAYAVVGGELGEQRACRETG